MPDNVKTEASDIETVHSIQLLFPIARKCRLRQRVACTASVFVHRTQLAFADSDLLLTLVTALWVASKVEEAAVTPAVLLDALGKLGLAAPSHRKR